MSNLHEQLDQLLAEDPTAAAKRAAAVLDPYDLASCDLVLYGAGTLGRSVLKRIRQTGIEPFAFADDTNNKEGTLVECVPVMAPQQVVERATKPVVFVVTILNPLLSFLAAQKRLSQFSNAGVISFLKLAWRYPESFLPYGQFELPQDVLAKRDEIRRGFALWDDDESRRQFIAHLRFRLYLDYEALPANSHDDYFPADLLPKFPDDVVFVDCGAFDGDSIRRFLAHQQNHFSKIHAFEPDAVNCAKLDAFRQTLVPDLRQKVMVHNAAVGDRRTKMSFNATGNMSAALATSGNSEVEVIPIQDVVKANGAPVYLKYDVEGAEQEAIAGAETLIREARPFLAISIYHRPDDLWQLPLYIASLDPNYRFYLRTQGEDGMDVICYALPNS
jgi:FkbM family methyltransferase